MNEYVTKQPRIIAVAAAAENNVIGKAGEIPWRVHADFKFWQDMSRGKPVIMGRKTYDHMPPAFKKRDKIIIITRQAKLENVAHRLCKSFEDALGVAHDICDEYGDDQIIIGGGGEIYKQAMGFIDEIYLSTIHTHVENGDAVFPDIDEKNWVLAEKPLDFAKEDGDTATATLRHFIRRPL